MKNFILIAIFSMLSLTAFGQFYDDCAGATGNVDALTAFPHSQVGSITAANTDDGTFDCTTAGTGSLTDPVRTAFYAFSVDDDGYYKISFLASGAAASGDLSVGWDPVSGTCPGTETDLGDITAGFDVTSDCVLLTAGTTYYISMALESPGSLGEFTITISNESIEVCEGATEVFDGDLLDNSCSDDLTSSLQGTIWSTYTVTGAFGPHVNVDITVTNGSLDPAEVYQVLLNDCAGDDVSVNATCLVPGDILFIETGNTDPLYGDYTINITESNNGVTNDDCVDATDLLTLSCATPVSGAFDADACVDLENTCLVDASGVWYRFTVALSVPTFSFTGTEFQVFTGVDCATMVSLGCAGDAALNDVDDNPVTTYWVLVYGGGDFTATSDVSVPVNDLCADAIELTSGTSVDGYNSCATGNFTYCGFDATSHQVYYYYTNGQANTVDIDIAIASSTASTGFDATDVGVAVITDVCDGTPFNNTPPVCNVLDASFNLGCIDPGETVIIVVGSADGTEGDFNITVTETISLVDNDVCDGAIDFGEIPSSCMQVDNGGNDNTGACSDDYNDGGCDFTANDMSSVWYTFSTDANAELIDIITDLSNATFSLYEGACGALTYVNGSCTSDGTLNDLAIDPSTTYTILIGSTDKSTFNIGITVKNIPDNNLCVDATDLVNDVISTNACADSEFNICDVDGTGHEVYFTYTNTNGANVDLNVTILDNASITGNPVVEVDVAVLMDDCNTLYNAPINEFCNTLNTEFTIECIEDGETIKLVVGSIDGEEGDFRIILTEDVSTVDNDECLGAEDLPYTPCIWENWTGDNTDACFEDFTGPGCDYDIEPVVWFSFDASAEATSVEFNNLNTAGTGFMGLFEDDGDCDNMTEADAGSGCLTAGAGPFGPFNITGGVTYLIAVGSSGGEGAIDFDMKVNESPVNDDPCAANFDPIDLDDGVAFTDDNTCATFDFTSCGSVSGTEGKTLFYEHTMTQDADLEIIVAGNTAGGPFAIATYEGVDCGDESQFIVEDCANNTLTIPCLLSGETVVIMIGTSESAGEFGEYDITVNENTPARPANDLCTDAEVITYEDTDLCKWVEVENNETNINACSEDNDFGTACDYTNEEVVWYTFTAPPATDPANAFLNIQFLSYTGGGTLFTTVFEDSGDCTALTPLSNCETGNGPHGALTPVTPGTTYLIGVGSSGDTGGEFEMEINITSGPPNDDACADLSSYDLSGGVTLTDQTNDCSVGGGDFPECSADDQTNAVFYNFTIVAPDHGINIEITASGADPMAGIVVGGISATDTDFCTGSTYTAPAYCENITTAQFEWVCLEPGTYQFKLSTSDNNAGTFDISSTMIEKSISSCNEHDLCDDATPFVLTSECEWVDLIGECNDKACPDPIAIGACDLTLGPTVWYSIVIPAGASTLDVIVDNTTFGNPTMIVASDCPVTTGWCGDGGTLATPIDVTGEDGNTFYIAVSDPSGGGGSFDLHVKIDVPPVNDHPCMAHPNPPFDLGTGGSHSGTTCCAVGANDDPNQDQANVDCNGLTDDNAVWYRVSGGGGDGVSINVSGGTIGGDVAVEIYVGGEDAACDGTAEFRKSDCDGLPVTDMRIGCLTADDYLFIKVTSTDGDCGTFSVDVTPIDDCEVADNCEDVTAAQTLDPVTDPNGSLNYDACASGCLDLACPENPNPPGCDFTQTPTVWFLVNTDADAAQLYSAVTTSGSWTPIWSVFSPDPDCSNLANAAGTGSFPCSADADPAAPPLITGVTEGEYYIAVTADPNGEPIDDPNFEICVATIITMVVCLGPDLGCAPEESLVFEIVEREFADAEPSGPPYLGPFCPGEELTVNLTFEYDATQTGNDWLIGIVPKFGPAWDLTGFDYNSFAPTGNGKTAEWYEEDGPCPPMTMEGFPFLCTYTDADGNLHLFNTLCEYADPTPCSGGLTEDEPLPSGYFWVAEGGSPDCNASNCSPAYKYGIGNPVANITWNFTMNVKEFGSQQECMDNDDLGISFMTFSDGGAGCWDDPLSECLIDKPQFSPPWEVNCDVPPGVSATPQPQEICTGTSANLQVTTDDGSVNLIEITFEENSEIDGASDHSFPDGFGTIDDILTLTDEEACGPETQIYYAQVIIPGMICEGRIDTFEVDVYPLPIIPEQEVLGACLEELPFSLTIEAECGYENNYSFEWVDDLSGNTGTTAEIIIDETFGIGLHTFAVTVTDGLGCANTGELQFNIYPSVDFQLQGDTLCWNEYHEFVPDLLGAEVSDFEFYWYWDTGEGFDGEDEYYEIILEEYGEVYQPGEWRLCLEVSEEHPDGVTCYKDTCVDVWIKKPLKISLQPDPIYICDGQGCVDVEIVFDEDNGLTFDEVVSISWNGTETNVPYHEYCSTGFAEWVDVVTENGCDTTIFFDILPNDIGNLEITGDTIICEGDSTTLTVVGDFVSYEWSTTDTTKSIKVSPTEETTTYLVSAMNASGCVSTGSITVHVFKAEIPDLPPTVSFCTNYTTTVTAPAGYATYAWYLNNITTPAVSTTAEVIIGVPGNYILVVTTAEGCEAQGIVVANEDTELTPSVIGDFLLCYDEATTLIKAIGGDFTVFEWRENNMSGALINTDPTQDSVYLSDGNYYLFVSDGNCDGDTTFTIVRKPEILPEIIPNTDTIRICYGEDTTLVAPAGFDAYQWSTGSFNDTIFNVGKGEHFVTVTDSDGCTGVDSIYVEVYPKMYPALGDSVEICANETAWLYPGEFSDYEWAKDGTPLPAFDGLDSIEVSDGGLFSVIVYNEIGCTEYDTILVKKTDYLTPNILGIVDLCDDDEIILTTTGTYFKYTWTNGDSKVLSTDDTLRFTMTLGKDTETITLVVESPTGCTGTDTKTVNRFNSPQLDLKDDVLEACGKQSTDGGTVLDFSSQFDVSDNTQGTWFDFDGSGATHNPDWSQVDFSNVDAGSTYRYVFTTNTATPPCENISDTLYVTVIECLCDVWSIASVNDVCNDASAGSVNLNELIQDADGVRISPPPAGSWTVTVGSSSPLNGTSFNAANAPSDVYTLTYTLADQGNYCEPSHEVTITVQNSVEPGEPNQDLHVCEGLDVFVRLDSMLVGEDAGGIWTEVSSVLSSGGVFDATAGTFSTAGQMPGTYVFNYRLIGVTPCPSADVDVTIVVDPVPVANAGDDVDNCFENKPVTLNAAVADNYEWTKQGSTTVISTNRSLDVSESGVYVLRVETNSGCFDEDEVSVIIQPQIIPTITGKTLLQNGETDTLWASVIGRNPSDIRIYNWTKDGEPVDLYVDNYFPISEAGVYCVEVEDNDGCIGTDCETVSVAITKEIEVPNIFSPDEDGNNDRFFVKDGKNVKHIRTFKVFDRWGELVFSDENFTFDERKNHFWDGTFNGKDAMTGVYVYLVEFTWNDDKEDFVAGDVTLVR